MTGARLPGAFLRTGGFLADTLFLAQALALCGLVLWQIGESDWAGFAVVGGSTAGMLSAFAFVIFGSLSWFFGAADFWRTLHPLNLSLAMCAAAGYAVIVYDAMPLALFSAATGFVAAEIILRCLPNHPRAWIAICLLVLSLRYALPWRVSGVGAAAAAVVVFRFWLQCSFPRVSFFPPRISHFPK